MMTISSSRRMAWAQIRSILYDAGRLPLWYFATVGVTGMVEGRERVSDTGLLIASAIGLTIGVGLRLRKAFGSAAHRET